MKKEILEKLVGLANALDQHGLHLEANQLDGIIQRASVATWTVEVVNEALKNGRWVGTFSSLEEATAYAEQEAKKSRKFATYQVCTGTPKKPGKPVGEKYRGQL